ncbi:MAG: hypothetical protein JRF40_13910 [Deltaproteobacteria bacterium]|nr:hypothetical protein [Deltaproteobacteria bacterium]
MKICSIIWKIYTYLFSLWIIILFTSCAGTNNNTVSSDEKTAAIQIKSTGIEKSDEKDKSFVLYFVQYSIDGKLLEAHEIKQNYNRLVKLSPGVHNLFVEYAHRGMFSARALLQKEGECYTFTVVDSQTVLFEGKALSREKWQAIGFPDVESSMNKCSLKECQAFLSAEIKE